LRWLCRSVISWSKLDLREVYFPFSAPFLHLSFHLEINSDPEIDESPSRELLFRLEIAWNLYFEISIVNGWFWSTSRHSGKSASHGQSQRSETCSLEVVEPDRSWVFWSFINFLFPGRSWTWNSCVWNYAAIKSIAIPKPAANKTEYFLICTRLDSLTLELSHRQPDFDRLCFLRYPVRFRYPLDFVRLATLNSTIPSWKSNFSIQSECRNVSLFVPSVTGSQPLQAIAKRQNLYQLASRRTLMANTTSWLAPLE
jgi:hypothetical protein